MKKSARLLAACAGATVVVFGVGAPVASAEPQNFEGDQQFFGDTVVKPPLRGQTSFRCDVSKKVLCDVQKRQAAAEKARIAAEKARIAAANKPNGPPGPTGNQNEKNGPPGPTGNQNGPH
jgi:hypothetical protein